MRYNVGLLPKKSMNTVYYSLDESFAFKEERNKVLCSYIVAVVFSVHADFTDKKEGCFSKSHSFGS